MDPEIGFDVDSAVNDIGSSLGFEAKEPVAEAAPEREEPAAEAAPAPQDAAPTEAPQPRQPPKSWAKEKHELWGKLPPDAQEYYEVREKQFLDGLEQYKGDATYAKEIKDAVTPYKAVLASQGVSESQAIQYLLNAHYRLSTGSPEERQAAYRQIGTDLGLVESVNSDQITDPVVLGLQKELNGIKSALSAQQQTAMNAVRADAVREVDKFGTDPSHPYFDEVSQDMVVLINAGHTLKDAYDKAVWANPVTRQKELTRLQTEEAAKLKEKAKAEAETARKATSTNVRGLESRKAPTEPLGSMEETMRDTLKKIKASAH